MDSVKEVSSKQGVYLKRLNEVEQENDTLKRLVDSMSGQIDELSDGARENARLKELVGQMAFQLGQVTAFIETIGYNPGFAPGEVMSATEDWEPIEPKSAKEIYEELVSKAPRKDVSPS
jgi:hypothetical protein